MQKVQAPTTTSFELPDWASKLPKDWYKLALQTTDTWSQSLGSLRSSTIAEKILPDVLRLLGANLCTVLTLQELDGNRWTSDEILRIEDLEGSQPTSNRKPSSLELLPGAFGLDPVDPMNETYAKILPPAPTDLDWAPIRRIHPSMKRLHRVIVTDRHNFALGCILVAYASENDSQSSSDPEALSAKMKFLAARARVVLEAVRYQTFLFRFSKNAASKREYSEIWKEIRDYCVALTHANYCDVAYHDWNLGKLTFGHRDPVKEDCQLKGNDPLESGLVSRCWEAKDDAGKVIGIVRGYPNYVECRSDTASELLVRVDQELPGARRRKLSVVNLESTKPQFFTDVDLEIVKQFVRDTVWEVLKITQDRYFENVLESLAQLDPKPVEIAERFLKSIRQVYGFDCGLMYWLDLEAKHLVAYAGVGIPAEIALDGSFRYALDEVSVATKVYRTKDYCYCETENALEVSSKGREIFKIRGSILGLPLKVKREIPGKNEGDGVRIVEDLIGVVVLWGSGLNPSPVEKDHELLAPVTQVGALVLRAMHAQMQRREYRFRSSVTMCAMQTTIDAKQVIATILEALCALGFRRVRVFKSTYSGSLEPYAQIGMDPVLFAECIQKPGENPYVDNLLRDFFKGPDASLVARTFTQPEARDAAAEQLRKKEGMPWASVPLVSAGKFYGELAADKLSADGNSWREIGAEDLECVTFFGAQAARAMAIEEKSRMVNAQAWTTLNRHVNENTADWAVRRCLLLFLTHGAGGGLGFNRAMFFEAKPGSEYFECSEAVGSLDPTEHGKKLEAIREDKLDLDRVLSEIQENHDSPLKEEIRGLRIPVSDPLLHPTNRVPPLRCSAQSSPNWLHEFGAACHAESVVLCPFELDGGIRGFILADRPWGLPAWEGDKAALETFVTQVPQILRHRQSQIELRKKEDLANLGMLTKGISHELSHLFEFILSDAGKLKALQSQEASIAVQETCEKLVAGVRGVYDKLDRLRTLTNPPGARRLFRPQDLLDDLTREFSNASEVVIHVAVELAELVAIPELIRLSLDNMIRNSIVALNGRTDPQIWIRVFQDTPSTVAIEVRDNGVGIESRHLRKVNRPGSGFTTQAGNRGTGYGIALVWWTALLHNGTVHIASVFGEGTTVHLQLAKLPEEYNHEQAEDSGSG